MRLCNSQIPEEYLVCYQMSQCNWVIIKMLYKYLWTCLLSWHRSRLGFVTPCIEEVSLGLSVMHITISLASNVTNELVAGCSIMKQVKRPAGNEIELDIEIPTIKSRASKIPMDKGNYVCCHNGSTDKDLGRICRIQYGHPGFAIVYWPERCLGHIYIVLEPVGSTRLTFVDDIVLYELYVFVTECCLES